MDARTTKPSGAEWHVPYKAEYVVSAARFDQLPGRNGDEYAIVGRSNVGKSSFINHVLENKSLARVSKTPGKTSLANFYRITDRFYFVDLPGYGHARVSGSEKLRWTDLIRDYCERRSNCAGIILLLDIRHPGVDADLKAVEWLKSIGRRILPVLTKADTCSRKECERLWREYIRLFGFREEPVIYSIREHASRQRFWERFKAWTDGRKS